jgi:predicted O-linked N-acetylglucosamine transferase (SPINDLY family)
MDRLAAAQAALNAGRTAEAIDHLKAAVDENPALPIGAYRVLAAKFYQTGRYAEAEPYVARGVAQHPRDYDLRNTYGVILRRLKRYPEAVAELEQAIKLNPKHASAQVNLGNALVDMGPPGGARAEQVFAKLARIEPRNAEYQRQLGKALLNQGKRDAAFVRFRSAIALKKDLVDAWLDIIGTLNEEHHTQEAEEQLDKAIAANPGEQRLLEAKVIVIRRSGQLRRAEAFLTELLAGREDEAWLHYQLGSTISDYDRERANVHMRRAIALDPGKLDYTVALIESLERTRSGDEGAHIEESYQLTLKALPRVAEFSNSHLKVAHETLIRVCDFDSQRLLGDFQSLGRAWAEAGRHTALLKQLGKVSTYEDRLELVEQHRIWGRGVEKAAAAQPIRRPPRRAVGSKIRLGLMSSDLRQHPVGYFALPLFDHVDPERVDLFVYSYYQGQEDRLQTYMTEKSAGYRWWPDVSAREAAQRIADDGLDMLIELGGSTHMNKLDVMAYRPAPLQASWLGYPHSAGLETIDYLVCDPYCRPEDPRLLIEKPLLMPKSWIGLGRMVFNDAHDIAPGLPQDRNGFITFGSANNPHKYMRDLFGLWAEVLLAVPGSKFAFIRPEGGSASFVRNIRREFAAAGVDPDRIIFHTIRGGHMPYYNEVDITLDTAPLTGGTTTTEALWMGVPVVSLIGPAFFERLSYSILTNTGVGDMATPDRARYIEIAAELAADRPRLLELRQNLRDMMKSGPLGQTETFAHDFYDAVERTVRERAGG